MQCVFIGFDNILYSHISPDSATVNKYQFNVRNENKKTQVVPKNNYHLSSLENEERRDLRYDRPSGPAAFWFQLPMPLWYWIKDLDLMVREYRPLWERQLPGKSGQP